MTYDEAQQAREREDRALERADSPHLWLGPRKGSEENPRYSGPPPQCVTCSKFVKVSTARRIYEMGDFGTVLSVEFECARCDGKRAA